MSSQKHILKNQEKYKTDQPIFLNKIHEFVRF